MAAMEAETNRRLNASLEAVAPLSRTPEEGNVGVAPGRFDVPRSPGDTALHALALLMGAMNIGDCVYTVREHEGLGWDGPLVKQWSDGCEMADAALKAAGMEPLVPRSEYQGA